jgi:hypothetical protein
MALASSKRHAGIGMRAPPHGDFGHAAGDGRADERSPGAPVTPAPTPDRPATSPPGKRPLRLNWAVLDDEQVWKLTPHALTAISTSPARGLGSGGSSSTSVSATNLLAQHRLM